MWKRWKWRWVHAYGSGKAMKARKAGKKRHGRTVGRSVGANVMHVIYISIYV